jgi:hypothetical protein
MSGGKRRPWGPWKPGEPWPTLTRVVEDTERQMCLRCNALHPFPAMQPVGDESKPCKCEAFCGVQTCEGKRPEPDRDLRDGWEQDETPAHVTDYACPDCGYDGPHKVWERDGELLTVECGDTACAVEFAVPVNRDEGE